jgi:hypothetical protein
MSPLLSISSIKYLNFCLLLDLFLGEDHFLEEELVGEVVVDCQNL